MTRDDIIRVAQLAGWEMDTGWDLYDGFMSRLERFANLVAAAEREACARVWPLYTAPRQWQGLTDEERTEFRRLGLVGVEIVEAKLKEKNA